MSAASAVAALRALMGPKYRVCPVEFPGTVHEADSWFEAYDWVRQYPESSFAAPTVLDRAGRVVRYAR